jgi:hypothetical protein
MKMSSRSLDPRAPAKPGIIGPHVDRAGKRGPLEVHVE